MTQPLLAETYETFLAATEGDLEPVLVGEATIGMLLAPAE